MSVIIPLVAAILGGLVYVVAERPKFSEMGRLTFHAGMFGTVFVLAERTLRVLTD